MSDYYDGDDDWDIREIVGYGPSAWQIIKAFILRLIWDRP